MKLNLGCGQNLLAGYCNVDKHGTPDVRWDLETFPWPWADGSVDEIELNHALEHMGQQPDVFVSIMKEIYRVARNGAVVNIAVPHPRHDNFISDPTHVRAIMPDTLALFSKKNNLRWKEARVANSPLALVHGVDFETKSVTYGLDEPYASDYRSGRLGMDQLTTILRTLNNVAHEIRMTLTVVK